MDWPALSPDLNPVENIWGMLAKRVYGEGIQFENIGLLEAAVRRECDKIGFDVIADERSYLRRYSCKRSSFWILILSVIAFI
jgi:transposase